MIGTVIGSVIIGACLGIGTMVFFINRKKKKLIQEASELLGFTQPTKINKEVKNGKRKFWERKDSNTGRPSETDRSTSDIPNAGLRREGTEQRSGIQETESKKPTENNPGIEPAGRSFEWKGI